MTRTRLDERRPAVTKRIKVLWGGKYTEILVTVGFDWDGKVKEVFCADFKAGSDIQAIVMDACVLASRLLQYGDSAVVLRGRLCAPLSLIGSVVDAAAQEEGPVLVKEGEEEFHAVSQTQDEGPKGSA